MPIRIDNDLPVKQILEEENIFVMDENRSNSQDIRPIDILILNLMPLKEDTELQLLRSLSNTPLQVNITFVRTLLFVFISDLDIFPPDFIITSFSFISIDESWGAIIHFSDSGSKE